MAHKQLEDLNNKAQEDGAVEKIKKLEANLDDLLERRNFGGHGDLELSG